MRNGALPDGWRSVRLGDIARISIGRTPPRARPEYWDPYKVTNNRWVTIADMRSGEITDTSEYISDAGATVSGAPLVPPGTPLMSFKLTVGRVAIPRVPVYTNEAIAAFYPNGDVSSEFLAYALPAIAQAGPSDAAVKGQTLNLAKLRELPLLLPPAAERDGIVSVLASIDDAIERTEDVIARAVEAKQALAHELLTRGLPGRHTRFKQTPVGEIPECWDVAELADCGRWVSGGTPARDRADYWNGSIPWVSGKDMKSQRLTDAEEHITQPAVQAGATLMERGTVLIVVRGMILAHTMPIAVLERPAAFNQDLKALRCRGDLNPYFVLYALTDRAEQMLHLVDEATHGTKRLSSERLMAVALPVPSPEEQEAIVRAVDDFDRRIQSERTQVEQLRVMKERLAHALLTGEVRLGKKEKVHGKV